MRRRFLLLALVGLSTSVLLPLGACASDTPATAGPDNDAAQSVPGLDGGEDAEAGPCTGADCEYFPTTCSPDALCPNGPFDPARPTGGPNALDLRTHINTITGRSASDVWAAGSVGALAHFDGTSWKVAGPTTMESLQGLRLFDSGELVFATMINRVFLRGVDMPDGGFVEGEDAGTLNAAGWTSLQKLPMTGALPSDAYDGYAFNIAWTSAAAQWTWCSAVANNRTSSLWRLRRRADATFEFQSPLPCSEYVPCERAGIASIHGTSPDVVWAVGLRGEAIRIAGADGDSPTFTSFDSLTRNELSGVWAASESEAWAVGSSGTIRHYRDGEPLAEIVPSVAASTNLLAVWGSSPSDIWAVGEASVVVHYDGKSWSRVKIAALGKRRPTLNTIWMPSPNHVWIGGDGVVLSLGGKP